jgi:hypothetical protein
MFCIPRTPFGHLQQNIMLGASLVFGVQITYLHLLKQSRCNKTCFGASALVPVLVLLRHHRIRLCGVQKGLSIPEPLIWLEK